MEELAQCEFIFEAQIYRAAMELDSTLDLIAPPESYHLYDLHLGATLKEEVQTKV